MTSIAAWREMFTQTVSIEAVTGRDRYANKTYGTAVTYYARVVGKRKQVLDAQGQQVVSSQTCYLYTADNILPDARVTLSTADVGSTESWAINPPILATGRFPDEQGQHHSVLYLR